MNTSAIAPQAPSSQRTAGNTYIKFRVDHQTSAAIIMQHVQEALILPIRRLTPMPNMASCILGLMNRRSRVMWVLDLSQLLGLSPEKRDVQLYKPQYNLVMIQVNGMPLGLWVHQIQGTTWLAPETIHPPVGQVSPSLASFLKGCVLQQQEEQQEMMLILDAEAIVQSPLLYSR